MVTLRVKASSPYDVVVTTDDEALLADERLKSASALWVITDENVDRFYGSAFVSSLRDVHARVYCSVVPAGEASKSLSRLERLVHDGLEKQFDRDVMIIAFGGGMIGDLAGFLASVYLRGVDFIQVPTTILAHDSAVGGKVAVNHPLAKNAIGAFYQPRAVYMNVSRFETLPDREVRSGLGELMKHAYLAPAVLERTLSFSLSTPRPEQREAWVDWLVEGIRVKRAVVEQDERESGVRAWLNFGHTFGHALEQEHEYALTHGECVLYGMVYALLVAGEDALAKQLYEWMRTQQVTNVSLQPYPRYAARMGRDKKNRHGRIRFVLLDENGMVRVQEMNEDVLLRAYEQLKGWLT